MGIYPIFFMIISLVRFLGIYPIFENRKLMIRNMKHDKYMITGKDRVSHPSQPQTSESGTPWDKVSHR